MQNVYRGVRYVARSAVLMKLHIVYVRIIQFGPKKKSGVYVKKYTRQNKKLQYAYYNCTINSLLTGTCVYHK